MVVVVAIDWCCCWLLVVIYRCGAVTAGCTLILHAFGVDSHPRLYVALRLLFVVIDWTLDDLRWCIDDDVIYGCCWLFCCWCYGRPTVVVGRYATPRYYPIPHLPDLVDTTTTLRRYPVCTG